MKITGFILAVLACSNLAAQPPKAENKTDPQGRKQGYWEKRDPKGNTLLYKGTFKDDKPQGLFTYYYPGTDSVQTKSDFRQNGKTAYVQIFYLSTGKIKAKGKYTDEKKDSTWNFYDERGVLISAENYLKGQKHGPSKVFFADGKVSEEKNYKNGLADGPFKMYFNEKDVKAEGKYVNGEYDGLCAWYYPNGIPAAKGLYDKGKKKGVWLYKDKEGTITGKEVYDNGRQLTELEAAEYFKKNKQAGDDKKENAGKTEGKQGATKNSGKK